MKLKSVLVGVVVAGLCVSAAVAAPPPGKGKPPTAGAPTSSAKPGKGKPSKTGDNCKPKVTVVLKGTVDTASAGSLVMDVEHSNRWGRAWADVGSATLTVDEDTKVRRNGNKTLAAELVHGEWVLAQARVCKKDLADDAMPPLTAARIVAHPVKA